MLACLLSLLCSSSMAMFQLSGFCCKCIREHPEGPGDHTEASVLDYQHHVEVPYKYLIPWPGRSIITIPF